VFYLLRTRFSYKYEQGQVRLFKSGNHIHWLLKALSPEDMPPQIETQDLVATMEGSPSADFLRREVGLGSSNSGGIVPGMSMLGFRLELSPNSEESPMGSQSLRSASPPRICEHLALVGFEFS
ncbi:hypothetical protein Gogos_006321, partial [Gossypium gossypioides]|nr:hypothetical protein [Gossypium gossypioides]